MASASSPDAYYRHFRRGGMDRVGYGVGEIE
jgi:hypothetical protein